MCVSTQHEPCFENLDKNSMTYPFVENLLFMWEV